MRDFSFFKLENSISEALRLSFDSPLSQQRYYQNIQLSPDEIYFQILNTKTGIEFNGDFTATLVDACGNLKLDITNRTIISEFIDSNGISQIVLELLPIKQDFHRQILILKLKHNTSNAEYFSTPFNLTNYNLNETTRFDYKNAKEFQGTDYVNAPYYQSIRVRTWYDRKANNSEITDYYQITSQNTISVKPLYKQEEIYKTTFLTEFTTERLDFILMHDIIYVDGVRMTNKTVIDNSERINGTNLRDESEFNVTKNFSDLFTPSFQIFEELALIFKEPEGLYSLGTLPDNIVMNFNKEILTLTGTVIIYDNSDDSIIDSFNQSDVSIVLGNTAQISIVGSITTPGEYRIEVSQGLFESNFGELSDFYSWFFTVQDGDFLNTDFNSYDFLTN